MTDKGLYDGRGVGMLTRRLAVADLTNAVTEAIHAAECDSPEDAADVAVAALYAEVAKLHRPFRIYGECGHRHTLDDITSGVATEVPEVGVTCEGGYLYTICAECCTRGTGYQLEECADDHTPNLMCHPCPTIRLFPPSLWGGE